MTVEYQNIFTRVQVRGPHYAGIPIGAETENRIGEPVDNYWAGMFGDAQIGPIYLGGLGTLSLLFGFIAFEIIGLNMLASVNWSAIEFIRQLPWLALEPPAPKYGLSIPPLNEGGWWLMAGFFLTASIFLWLARTYKRAKALGMGQHMTWAFASAIFLYLSIGLFQPVLVGSWSESVPFGIFPHLDWTAAFSIRYGNLYYNPFHCCRSPSCTARHCCSRCTVRRFSPSAATVVTARSTRSRTGARPRSGRHCSGAGRWASTPRWNRSTAGPGGSPCSRP
jgi:photosynthetic reaction center M subunit